MKKLILILLLALLAPAPAQAESVDNPELSAYASKVAGSPMHIVCVSPEEMEGSWGYIWSTTDGEGKVTVFNYIYVDGALCGWAHLAINYPLLSRKARRFANTDNSVFWAGLALLVIRHEVTHVILQSIDEGLVECTAVKNLWNDVWPLYPRSIAKRVYSDAIEWHLDSRSEYLTVC